MRGAELLVRTLGDLGTDVVFGLPGSQNVALFEALRASSLRTVVPTSELAASFMANGYARASGRPGVLVTIPGPGFTWALTGLAEACLDSVPLVHVAGAPAEAPGRRYQLQALDQAAMARPVVKNVIAVDAAERIEHGLHQAFALAVSGEPGPVLLQVSGAALSGSVAPAGAAAPTGPGDVVLPQSIVDRLRGARRPVLYTGQGAFGATVELRRLVEGLHIPLVTTTSGRGVLPEDHPWVLRSDGCQVEELNLLLETADVVLVLGCKFSHNGARGFRLRIDPARLVHVDASPEVPGSNFEASGVVIGDVPRVVERLREQLGPCAPASEWTPDEVCTWRRRLAPDVRGAEPRLRGLRPDSVEAFFAALRRALPAESCLVVDSGLHQVLARRHFEVLRPRGLILPTNLQSMGYAISAAIGARLARPREPVVALLGDGGFGMCGLELLTAVKEGLDLVVIVLNDGRYGLIHGQQLDDHGVEHGTTLRNPNFQLLAQALGAQYHRLEGSLDESVARALGGGAGVKLIEVQLRDSLRQRIHEARRSIQARLGR